jgi:hypothetical protein
MDHGIVYANDMEIEMAVANGIDDDNNGYVDDVHGYDFSNNDRQPGDRQWIGFVS